MGRPLAWTLGGALAIAAVAVGVTAGVVDGWGGSPGSDPGPAAPAASTSEDASAAPGSAPGAGGPPPEEEPRAGEEPDAADRAERRRAERDAEEERQAERDAEEERQAEREAEAEREADAQREAEEEAERAEAEERAELVAAQERLAELGYLVGRADGEQGQQTTAALMAFQAVNGLQVDGILGPQTRATLAEPRTGPQLRDGPATRIEVDLDQQVLHLVEDGTRTVTFKTSTGNGAEYVRGDGSRGRAVTPVGTFTIERRISGLRESSAGLGTLYDPMYFHRGFAIHGSNSVPAGPASHGCVRLARADAVWLFDRVPNGTPVVLHGGVHTFTP